MAPNSSENKIVSLHLQGCNGHCPNASVCYHTKKVKSKDTPIIGTDKLRRKILETGYKTYESVCILNYNYTKNLIKEFPNYNITISCKDIGGVLDDSYLYNNIQVSVYNMDDINDYKNYQKLFLIKNSFTYLLALSLFTSSKNYGKVHIIIDQNYIKKEPQNLIKIIKANNNKFNQLISLDTCISSFVVNGHCPYNNKNYIDINYDSTIRKCPYSKTGSLVLDNFKSIPKLFNTQIENKCIYTELFKGILNERINKNPDLQDNSTDNGIRSNFKRMRRFSLRS